MTKLTMLPGETVPQARRRERVTKNARACYQAVTTNPGLPSKAAVAAIARISPEDAEEAIASINSNEYQPPIPRLEYGELTPRGGPYAGQLVQGWFPMDKAIYHRAIEQAVEFKDAVITGLRNSQIRELLFIRQFTAKESEAVLADIARSHGLSIPANGRLSDKDFDKLKDLILNY